MNYALAIVGILIALVGIGAVADGPTAVQQIGGFIIVLIGTVMFSAGCIITAINQLKKALAKVPSHVEMSDRAAGEPAWKRQEAEKVAVRPEWMK